MVLLALLAGTILVYAIYKQVTMEPSLEALTKKNDTLNLEGYNPYILNQYIPWKDRINSADVAENDIWSKPVKPEFGIYGITEEHIKLNPVDGQTVLNSRINLNL